MKKRLNANGGALNETFTNAGLNDMIQQHGGLKRKRLFGDARMYTQDFDLQYAEAADYIEPEEMAAINKLDWTEPVVSQILACNDGGAIVISHGENNSGYRSPGNLYREKIRARNKNHDELYGGIVDYTTIRRADNFRSRGKKVHESLCSIYESLDDPTGDPTGRRIRVLYLPGESESVMERYRGRTGTIDNVDDAGVWHIIWDGTDRVSGLGILPEEDEYEFID